MVGVCILYKNGENICQNVIVYVEIFEYNINNTAKKEERIALKKRIIAGFLSLALFVGVIEQPVWAESVKGSESSVSETEVVQTTESTIETELESKTAVLDDKEIFKNDTDVYACWNEADYQIQMMFEAISDRGEYSYSVENEEGLIVTEGQIAAEILQNDWQKVKIDVPVEKVFDDEVLNVKIWDTESGQYVQRYVASCTSVEDMQISLTDIHTAKISWKDNSSENTGYKIYIYEKNQPNSLEVYTTNQLTYTIDGLKQGIEYVVDIVAYTEKGDAVYYGSGIQGTVISELTAAQSISRTSTKVNDVTNVRAVAGECKVDLTWQAANDATGYGIYMQDTETGNVTTVVMDTYGTSYEVTNLTPGTSYIFSVRSYKKENGTKIYGNMIQSQEVAPIIKNPGEITGLKADVSERAVTLTWSVPSEATETVIYQMNEEDGSWELIGASKGNSFQINKLEGGHKFTFAVKPKRWVYKQSSQGQMKEIEATPIAIIPQAPGKLSAKAGECDVTLTWQAGKDTMGYGIYMKDVETGKTTTVVMDTYDTTYKVTNLVPDRAYTFTVRSYRKVDGVKVYGESSETEEVIPYIQKVGNITGLKAVAGEHQVTLSWNVGNNSTETVVYQKMEETGQWKLIASAKGNTAVIKNLEANKKSILCVKPKRWVYQQVNQGEMTAAVSAVPTEVYPAVAAGVKATAGDEEITLTWNTAENATGYKVYAYDKSTGQQKFVASTRAKSCTVTGLKNGQEYSYRIVSYRQCDSFVTLSQPSNVVSAKPVMTPPTAPSSLSVEYKSGNNNLSWPAVNKATGYYVYLYNYNTNKYEELAKVTTNSYVHKGEGKKGKYKYMVKTYREDNGQMAVSKNGVEKLVFGADDIANIKTTVHPMYYSATINQSTRLYNSFSAEEKCGTISPGERVTVLYRRSGRCTIKRKDGSVVYIKTSALNFTAEHYTSNDYTTEQKELFVNSQGYSSKTKYLIWMNTYTQRVNIFEGSKGNWKLIRNSICASGAIDTPTPPGLKSLYEKQKTHKYAHSHYDYLSKFQSENCFHTRIKYYSGGYVDSRLGRPLSHGCVRMKDNDATYIYNNMPLKTTVLIY